MKTQMKMVMHNNRIELKINATTIRSAEIAESSIKAPLINQECSEIDIKIQINNNPTTAIIDTGSPITVISKRLYNSLEKSFSEENIAISGLKKTSVFKTFALFSCESNGTIETLCEFDVKLIHADFQCISPLIVTSNLAHDCFIGMNVLTKWPTMNNAINVLRKVKLNKNDTNFNLNLTSTRLHNIC